MFANPGRYGYSAITKRRPFRWPNGAGFAIYIAFGIEEYVFAEGRTEDILLAARRT
jgi:uncharacterized membrane-anchored protein